MTSKIVVNNIEADAGVSTVFFNSDIGATDGTLNVDGNLTVDGVITYEDVTSVDSVGLSTFQNGIHVTSGQVLVAKTTTSITTEGSRVDNGLISVSGNSNSTNLATNGGGNLSLANIDSTDNNFSNIGGYNSNGLVVSQIDFINKSHSSRTGDIAFLTHDGTTMSESLRITSDGKVLISRFDDGSAGPYLELYNNSDSPADNDYTGSINFKNNNSAAEEILYAEIRGISRDITDGSEDGEIQFYTERQGSFGERVRICADQGSGSNESRLDIIGGNVNVANIGEINGSLRFRSNDASVNSTENVGAQISAVTEASNGAYVGMSFYTFQQGGSGLAESLRITNAGNIVIGHSAANAKLQVNSGTGSAVGDATNPAFQIGNIANYRFGIYTTSEQAIIANKNGDDGIAFHTKTANSGSFGEALRITTDGKVGIGSIAPQNLLNVNASGSMGLYGTIAGKVGHAIRFIRKYGSSATHSFATINGASPHGQSRLGGFIVTYTYRSAYGFDSAGGGHGIRMLSGRVRDSGEWDFDSETNTAVGDGPLPTLQGADNNDGTCTLQVVNPSSTHSYGEFHIVTWDCVITSPSA